jgi:hypothetical protein
LFYDSFAHISFTSASDHVQALKLSEFELEGRKVLIKDVSDFKGRPTQLSLDSSAPKSKFKQPVIRPEGMESSTLFFGNLPFETTVRYLISAM